MSRILYYLIIYPLSFLPLKWLYVISDALYLIIGKVIAYREKVIKENVNLVFPNKEDQFKNSLISTFYKHLCDLIVEAIKAFSISNRAIKKRYDVKGADVTFDDYHKGKNIIVVSAHIGNWEWASLACPLYFKHQCAVIVTPLSDGFLNKKISRSRSRNGYDLVPKHDVKEYLGVNSNVPRAIFFLSDQSPSNPERAYWTDFMGINSPVQYGVEKYAREYNMPIYYINVARCKRGYYDVEVTSLLKDPSNLQEGDVIKRVTKHIETNILKNPGQWLWSHRRWKHKEKRVEN